MKRSLTSPEENKFYKLKSKNRSNELAPKRNISSKLKNFLNVFKKVFHQSISPSPNDSGSNTISKLFQNLLKTPLKNEEGYFSAKNVSIHLTDKSKRDVIKQSNDVIQEEIKTFDNLGTADSECLPDTTNLSQVSISDVILAWLRFKTAIKAKTETDCLKRILCEMNSIVTWRNFNSRISRMFAQLGTFAILQHQNVLEPSEDLLRAARTGRQLEAAGNCQRIYYSCSSWDKIAHAAEMLWIPLLKNTKK